MQQHNRQQAESLLAFIESSPTAFHATACLQDLLTTHGFTPYTGAETLQPGDRRYFTCGSSALYAFVIGPEPFHHGFRLIGAHNDAPALVIKPNSLITAEGCLKVSTEVYGGPILNTWYDRPLALAGRIVCESDDPLKPATHLVRLKEPLLVIPNAAIHMNRTVNEGQKIEPQKMLLPVLGLAGRDPSGLLEQLLATAAGVDPHSIVDFDLFLHDATPGAFLGLDNDLINAPRLDNLGMAFAAITALIDAPPQNGINLAACFDHEEIGSRTRQGAQSMVLRDLLERICLGLGGSRTAFLDLFEDSFLISADQAHAVHPNFAELADATNRPRINGGPVIKRAADRSYTTDAETSAVFKTLCRQADVPCQTFVNRSDMRGGSTIGPLFIQNLPIRSVDVGNPIWAMHAIRETGGVADHAAMLAVFRTFYAR